MRCRLDLCFLDRHDCPVRLWHRVPVARWYGCRQAYSVLELPVGYLACVQDGSVLQLTLQQALRHLRQGAAYSWVPLPEKPWPERGAESPNTLR